MSIDSIQYISKLLLYQHSIQCEAKNNSHFDEKCQNFVDIPHFADALIFFDLILYDAHASASPSLRSSPVIVTENLPPAEKDFAFPIAAFADALKICFGS